MGAVFNAAKERALDHFIAGRIGFLDMAAVVARVLAQFDSADRGLDEAMTLDTVSRTDHLARMEADNAILDYVR